MGRRVCHTKTGREVELDSSGSRQGNVTGCFEHGINPLGSTKCGELQDYLRKYKFIFFKDSTESVVSPSVECSYSTRQLIP